MKLQPAYAIIIVGILIAAGLFLLSEKVLAPDDNIIDNGEKSCVLNSCHGYVDLECAMMEPLVCTVDYRGGDKCRQFVSCIQNNNGCEKVIDPRYESCKSCVQACEAQYKDAAGFFGCETACGEE